jgi:formate-nitrite transporter family protein
LSQHAHVRAPGPEEIYERTREEGQRRLRRPFLELAATALVGGFDVAFGVAAYGLAAGALGDSAAPGLRHLVGALAFGIGFVFVIVGRSELFTENFLVPIAGLERSRGSYRKLAELWVATLVLNIAGGTLIAVIVTSKGVLPFGAADLRDLAVQITARDAMTAFLSAIAAGALMTLMTWFVEGAADSMSVRIVMAWIVGALVVLGMFNHAIVGQIELIYGLRYGAHVSFVDYMTNLGLAVSGNLAGGLGLVTFARFAQAVIGPSSKSSA